jgi:ATP-dependent Clp protease ATP-binding subunit ClpC
VVILTSNIGTRHIHKKESLGFHTEKEESSYEKMKEKVLAEVKKTFNPEFLNRIDEIIVFNALDEEDIKTIVQILVGQLNERLAERDIVLEMSEEVIDFLVKQGYDQEYGARPLRRAIQRSIEDPLSFKLIEGSIPNGSVVETVLSDSDIEFRVKREEPLLTAEKASE